MPAGEPALPPEADKAVLPPEVIGFGLALAEGVPLGGVQAGGSIQLQSPVLTYNCDSGPQPQSLQALTLTKPTAAVVVAI